MEQTSFRFFLFLLPSAELEAFALPAFLAPFKVTSGAIITNMYFQNQWERTNFFKITEHEVLEERPHSKTFVETQASLPTEHSLVFLWCENFL